MATRAFTLERALSPLDWARCHVLRVLGRPGRALLANREARVAVGMTLSLGVTLAMTLAAPIWMLTLGPIVLGVPHLLADARYLVARQGLHRRPALVLLAGVPLAITFVHPSLWVGMLAIAGAVIATPGRWSRRGPALVVAIALAAVAYAKPFPSHVVFAHAHNVAALVLFAIWAKRDKRWHVPAIALAAAITWLILGGALDGAVVQQTAFDVDLPYFARGLSLSRSPEIGVRLTLWFCFAQSLHYAVWLRLVPEMDREREGIRSFASSYRALVRDLGLPVLASFGVLAIGLIAWAVVDLYAARDGYLRLSLFHGPLELAALAIVFIEGRATVR